MLHACNIENLGMGLSRKFWSVENFGLGGQNFWTIGPPWTEIFENFGPIVEKWSTHVSLKLIASDVCQRINRKMIDDQPHFVKLALQIDEDYVINNNLGLITSVAWHLSHDSCGNAMSNQMM